VPAGTTQTSRFSVVNNGPSLAIYHVRTPAVPTVEFSMVIASFILSLLAGELVAVVSMGVFQ
jgi:hypothetical protein